LGILHSTFSEPNALGTSRVVQVFGEVLLTVPIHRLWVGRGVAMAFEPVQIGFRVLEFPVTSLLFLLGLPQYLEP
jgi:hypothetical protein